jgi:hypothetical protein
MPSTLTINAIEKSTFVINVAFTDEDSSAVTPTAATWTLTDCDGSIINSREDVTIASLDTNVDVVLSANDLALQSGSDNGKRVFLVEGTYDSTLGAGLPFKDQAEFFVADLVAVT